MDSRAERFFKLLVCAIRAQGIERIPAWHGEHHAALRAVMRHIETLQPNRPGSDQLYRAFPGLVTGEYDEWDTALLRDLAGLGITRTVRFYGIEIMISPERAVSILDRCSDEVRGLFAELAQIFLAVTNDPTAMSDLRREVRIGYSQNAP